jgi:probable rRNA maturation factor
MTRRRTLARRRNNVTVQYAIARAGVPAPGALRRWARAAAPGLTLTVRVVGRREGRELNRRYRRRDHATNVLSFPYGESGDVVLCHPVIAHEAREQGKGIRAHYAHLVVHSALHLRGYGHDDNASASRMESAEIRILRRMGFGNPYTVESGRTA